MNRMSAHSCRSDVTERAPAELWWDDGARGIEASAIIVEEEDRGEGEEHTGIFRLCAPFRLRSTHHAPE